MAGEDCEAAGKMEVFGSCNKHRACCLIIMDDSMLSATKNCLLLMAALLEMLSHYCQTGQSLGKTYNWPFSQILTCVFDRGHHFVFISYFG